MAMVIRDAERADSATILMLINELAAIEQMEDAVRIQEADLLETGFGQRRFFDCVLAEEEGQTLGFALYYYNFSTFEGRPGVYLEDLYVREQARGKGVGRALIAHLARHCRENDFRRVDLSVLHWNSARRFYETLGLKHNEDWLGYRLEGDALKKLAEES